MSTSLEPVRRRQSFAGVAPRAVFDVIADIPSYPKVFKEMSEARVLEVKGQRTRAEFKLPMLLPVRYVLDLVCDPQALSVSWTFVEGDVVDQNEGGWRLAAEADGTSVEYFVTLSVKAPVPGFVLRKIVDGLVSASLPGMFKALETEVRRRAAVSRALSG